MDDAKTPTRAELDVLRVLWERGEGTVRDAHEALSRERTLGYTTVLKTMQIMARKGLLRRTEQGRGHLYAPAQPEDRAKRGLAQDLLDRVFGGSASDLVLHALAAKPASAEEIAEIRRMLDAMEAEP